MTLCAFCHKNPATNHTAESDYVCRDCAIFLKCDQDEGRMVIIPNPDSQVQALMNQWEVVKQSLIEKDFSRHSEDHLIGIMLTAIVELHHLGFRRIDKQWVSLSEAN